MTTRRKKQRLRILNSRKQLVLQPIQLTVKQLMVHPQLKPLVTQHQSLMLKSNVTDNHAPEPVQVAPDHALAAAVDRPAEVQLVDREAAAVQARLVDPDHGPAVARSLAHAPEAVHVPVRDQILQLAPPMDRSTVVVPPAVDLNQSLHQNLSRVAAVVVHLVHVLALVPARQAVHAVAHQVVQAPALAAALTRNERDINCNSSNIYKI